MTVVASQSVGQRGRERILAREGSLVGGLGSFQAGCRNVLGCPRYLRLSVLESQGLGEDLGGAPSVGC